MPPSLEHLVDRQVGNGLSRITASEAVYDTEGWGRLPRVLNFAKPNTAFQASLRAALARCADGLACEAWNAHARLQGADAQSAGPRARIPTQNERSRVCARLRDHRPTLRLITCPHHRPRL